MIVIYTSPGCVSCNKVRKWLKDHSLVYIEKNIFNTLLKREEIKYILSRCENGTDDIISKRSKIMIEGKIDIEQMTVEQLIDFIVENPSILKRPIIISEESFQVGYDADEIDILEMVKEQREEIELDYYINKNNI